MGIVFVARALVVCFCCCLHIVLSEENGAGNLRIYPCGDDNTAEVLENYANSTFICKGIRFMHQMEWRLSSIPLDQSLGTCPEDPQGAACLGGGLNITVSKVSSSVSRLVIDSRGLVNTSELVTLKCKDQILSANCQVDYIVPIQGNCSIHSGTGESPYRLNGSCSLQSGAKSLRNRFSCIWIRNGTSAQRYTVELTEEGYEEGCTLTEQLPAETGHYSYHVQLIPGRLLVPAGTVNITRPQPPTVSNCGGEGYILENTTVTCTCSTKFTGQPPARVQWRIVDASGTSDEIEGSYDDDSSVSLSRELLRSDHQSTRFQCKVLWTVDVIAEPILFNVGYPPRHVDLSISGLQDDLTVEEHQGILFRCGNASGRPELTVSLVKVTNDTVLVKWASDLEHHVVVSCEDTGQYVCTAENIMGPKVMSTPASLFVTCPPRGNYDLGKVNFIDQPQSVTFQITAYPAPDGITFLYLGASATSDSSAVQKVNNTAIQLMGVCLPDLVATVHLSTCTVTVTRVTTATVVGFYQVTVSNSQGTGHFRLQVLFRAEPESDSPSSFHIAVGACAASGVIIIVVVIIVWLCRRQRERPQADLPATELGNFLNPGAFFPLYREDRCDRRPIPGPTSGDYTEVLPWDVESTDSGDHTNANKQPDSAHDYLTPLSPPGLDTEETRGPYASLHMADVGASDYTDISSKETRGPYASLHMADVGASDYTDISSKGKV